MLINLRIILFAIPIIFPLCSQVLSIILKIIPDLMLMALQKLIYTVYYQLSVCIIKYAST